MTMEEQIATREAKTIKQRKDAFARFMDQPATRMMVSMIPAGEKQEVLETLLQETFNYGFNCGSGNAMGEVVEALFKNMDKRSRAPE